MIVSRECDKCKKCKKCKERKDCNNKRLVACMVKEIPQEPLKPISTNYGISYGASSTSPAGIKLAKEYTPITIHMGEYGDINTSMEEIKEQIAKTIQIGVNCSALR